MQHQQAWSRFFENPLLSMQTVKEDGIQGKIQQYGLRSLYWKVYLEYLPSLHPDAFLPILEKERKGYNDLRAKYIVDPNQATDDLAFNNPLSLEEDSAWSKYFKDNELLKTIKQDVERTFPEHSFFRSHRIQQILNDVLFIWCKINPDLAYRQGMHELLAVIVYVVEMDKLDYQKDTKMNPIVKALFDSEYVEHDSSVLFFRLMRSAKGWYELGPDIIKNSYKSSTLPSSPMSNNMAPIVSTSLKIQNEIIRVLDVDLYQHLSDLNIEPQLYGLRWIRLLFAREFSFQDCLLIWDGLFAVDPNLSLVEWVCASMLLYLKKELMSADYSEALYLLMKFPGEHGLQTPAHTFIHSALNLRHEYNNAALLASHSSPTVSTHLLNSHKKNEEVTSSSLSVPSLPRSPIMDSQIPYHKIQARDHTLVKSLSTCISNLSEILVLQSKSPHPDSKQVTLLQTILQELKDNVEILSTPISHHTHSVDARMKYSDTLEEARSFSRYTAALDDSIPSSTLHPLMDPERVMGALSSGFSKFINLIDESMSNDVKKKI